MTRKTAEHETVSLPEDFSQKVLEGTDIAAYMGSLPRKAGGLLYRHFFTELGEGELYTRIAKWSEADESRVNYVLRYMLDHAERSESFAWKGGRIPELHHLFPDQITGKHTFKKVLFSAPEVHLLRDTSECLKLLPYPVRSSLDDKYIFSPGAMLSQPFRVLDWHRKGERDEPLDGVLVFPFVATVAKRPNYLEENIWGTYKRLWMPESMKRITNKQKELDENRELAHLLEAYNISTPYEGGAFGQNS